MFSMRTLRRLISKLRTFIGAHGEKPPSGIDFEALQKVLNYSIHNKELFHEALMHRSYLQIIGKESATSNERLEFLGDSVLNLIIGEYLYYHLPDSEEGELTKIRSRFVNRKALIILAHDLQLREFLLLSPSANQIPGKGKETILSDAFEAILGAIYLDGGYKEAKKFVERCLNNVISQGSLKLHDENYKSQLLEQSQAISLDYPKYITISEVGPDHDRTFTVEVFLGKKSFGVGVGKNKKDAEQSAAKKALQKLNLNKSLT
ncbi:MAG: ribonuclease III [Bacteroidota bacterium]|nr:ribonuclease III [Bacteroidota bacterium]